MTQTAGYFPKHWIDQRNPSGALLRFACAAGTGTTSLAVRRSWDFGSTWDDPITVVASLPAQKVDVRGDGSSIVLCYHEADGDVVTLQSDDEGGTWA